MSFQHGKSVLDTVCRCPPDCEFFAKREGRRCDKNFVESLVQTLEPRLRQDAPMPYQRAMRLSRSRASRVPNESLVSQMSCHEFTSQGEYDSDIAPKRAMSFEVSCMFVKCSFQPRS